MSTRDRPAPPDALGAERRSRAALVWQQSGPTDEEIATARRRMAMRTRPNAVRWQGSAAWALAGAGATAALVMLARVMSPPPEPMAPLAKDCAVAPAALDVASGAAPTPAADVGLPFVERGGARTPLTQGTRIELDAGQRAAVVTGIGSPVVLEGPSLVEMRRDAEESSGWRAVYLEGSPIQRVKEAPKVSPPGPSGSVSPTAKPAPSSPAGAPGAEESWARAADAMKKSDFDGADRAFSDLNTSGDRATREASRLARAELWIAHGRGAEVRPILSDLANTGSTEFVRKRAATLLAGSGSKP